MDDAPDNVPGAGHRRHPPGAGGTGRGGTHAGIGAGELVRVCSHYDIGVVESVHKFRRGSASAPKVILKTSTGPYLLKRRARGAGRDDPFRVALSHEIQLHLREHGFPVPRLIGTRSDNNSMVQLDGRIYELFEFVEGVKDDRSSEAATEAGRAVAQFHAILDSYRPAWTPPSGTYHRAPGIIRRLELIPARLAGEAVAQLAGTLRSAYEKAGAAAESLGYASLPDRLIHGDWHPGNLLFAPRDPQAWSPPRLVAVVDFDSVRLGPRVADIAGAALQVSLRQPPAEGGESSGNAERKPFVFNEPRFKAFFAGYHAVPGSSMNRREIDCLPWLMIEALVAEAAIPVAATGRFGRLDGLTLLGMVERKVKWLVENRPQLEAMIAP